MSSIVFEFSLDIDVDDEASQCDSVMRDNRTDDAEFIFYVSHAPANTVEGSHEGYGPPETQKMAEKAKMKHQIADVHNQCFDEGLFYCLNSHLVLLLE